MKRFSGFLPVSILFALMYCLSVSHSAYAQIPPPPDNGVNNGHGLGGNQGTQGAPIGGGSEILIVLGALYAGKKMYHVKAAREE